MDIVALKSKEIQFFRCVYYLIIDKHLIIFPSRKRKKSITKVKGGGRGGAFIFTVTGGSFDALWYTFLN